MQLSFWEKNSFQKYDFIIVGAGILGLSAACEIKERSPHRSVLVLERGIMPSGASTRNAGFACFGSLTEILSDITRIGKEKTFDLVSKRFKGIELLRSRLGDENIGYLNYGGYELINEEHLDALNEIENINLALKGIFDSSVFEIKNECVEKFGFNPEEVRSMIYSPFESQIDTGAMMDSMLKYAAGLGIRIIFGCEVTGIGEKENHVNVFCHSVSDNKTHFECGCVIVCTNAFTGKIFPELKINPGRGHVLITKPISNLKFKGVFHFDEGYYYFRNFGDRVIFGGGRNLDFENEKTTDFSLNEKIKEDLTGKLSGLILPDTSFEIDQWWTGIMGFNESKMPEVRKLSDRIIFSFSCNGMGIALSSCIAKEIADAIPSV